jgi:hypothetical protein
VKLDKSEAENAPALKRAIIRKVLRGLYHTEVESLFNLVTNEALPFPAD